MSIERQSDRVKSIKARVCEATAYLHNFGSILKGEIMSFVGSMLGIGDNNGNKGASFTAANAGPAQQAALVNPVTGAQAQQQIGQTQGAIGQQQALANALQAQNGIGNQSSVFNQLQGVANGTGPNPAQAMLAQSTGANTANQAALMAGQRGAGANAGLLARQAAQQGAANQQNAAGQAATMQANQSLGALNQLGGIAGQQVGQQMAGTGAVTQANLAQQGQMLGQVGAQNQAALQQAQNTNQFNLGNTEQQNKSNTTIQEGNLGAQKEIAGGVLQGIGAAVGLAHGGSVPHYAEGTPSSVPSFDMSSAPAAPTIAPATGPKSSVGKILSAATSPSSGPGQPPLTQGVKDLFGGIGKGIRNLVNPSTPTEGSSGINTNDLAGSVAQPSELQHGLNDATSNPDVPTSAPKGSNIFGVGTGSYAGGGLLSSIGSSLSGGDDKKSSGGASGLDPSMLAEAMAAKGGKAKHKVPAMVSPGEIYLQPGAAKEVAKGKKSPMSGEHIKGQAKVKGDSLQNDTVPKTLEEGGVVIPRSVLEGPNAHWAAHKFVKAAMSKSKKK